MSRCLQSPPKARLSQSQSRSDPTRAPSSTITSRHIPRIVGHQAPRRCRPTRAKQCEASMVVLGPAATSEYFNIAGSIQSTNTSLYLNIGSDSTSYKSLTFGAAAGTTGWGLEGDTIITTQTSSYGRRKSVLARGVHAQWLTLPQSSTSWPASWMASTGRSISRQEVPLLAARLAATTSRSICLACARMASMNTAHVEFLIEPSS